MRSDFTHALEHLLRRFDARGTPSPAPVRKPAAEPAAVPGAGAADEAARHARWFNEFAGDHVMPLLTHTVEALKRRGFEASCRLIQNGASPTAELVVVPPGLPKGAKPPRLAVSAAPGRRGIGIDYTGTFPHSGVEGRFGAEIIYDTIYTADLEEQLLEFVRMATGA